MSFLYEKLSALRSSPIVLWLPNKTKWVTDILQLGQLINSRNKQISKYFLHLNLSQVRRNTMFYKLNIEVFFICGPKNGFIKFKLEIILSTARKWKFWKVAFGMISMSFLWVTRRLDGKYLVNWRYRTFDEVLLVIKFRITMTSASWKSMNRGHFSGLESQGFRCSCTQIHFLRLLT